MAQHDPSRMSLDVRGGNAYAVAAGSVHATGVVYEAEDDDATVAAMTGGRIRMDRANPDEAASYIVWSLLAATPENNLTRRPPAGYPAASTSTPERPRRRASRSTCSAAGS